MSVPLTGIDLISTDRIRQSVNRFGDRFLRRVFTPQEISYCESRGAARFESYAARFAAKESVIKLLGGARVVFTEVEILAGAERAPVVRTHGRAGELARRQGISDISVSMSHEDSHAIAVAFAWREVPRRAGGEGTAMMTNPATENCRIALLAEQDAFPRIREIYRMEVQRHGRVRHMTQATANSLAAWQATTRALQLYSSLRRIDRPLVDLLCLYTSMLNGCRYCIDDAAGEALVHSGWSASDLLGLDGDLDAHYSPAVAAALGYAEALTKRPDEVSDELIGRLKVHYDDEAVLEISCVVGMKNFWNRLATGLRIPPEGKCPDERLFARLVGISDRWRAAARNYR